ncbi:hypothetical protein CRENBAI_011888 [Crenichthys baileyi]|uniref:Uncharacterized protein n=1 Tax=Crenichthys baileyi TaxID=28760 RepID=A0AAV9SEW1_9TELE
MYTIRQAPPPNCARTSIFLTRLFMRREAAGSRAILCPCNSNIMKVKRKADRKWGEEKGKMCSTGHHGRDSNQGIHRSCPLPLHQHSPNSYYLTGSCIHNQSYTTSRNKAETAPLKLIFFSYIPCKFRP